MYLVLGPERLKSHFDEDTIEFWFNSYIELLQQFQLINEATKVNNRVPNILALTEI